MKKPKYIPIKYWPMVLHMRKSYINKSRLLEKFSMRDFIKFEHWLESSKVSNKVRNIICPE